MENLIQLIQNNQGESAISAKGLFTYLGYQKNQWARWYKTNISNNKFAIEDIDFQTFDIVLNGNPTKDFALSIDFAKKIAMLARSEKGEQARNYFIECEKIAKESIKPQIKMPQSFAEALRLYADEVEKTEKLQIENARLHERTDFVDKVFTADDLLTGAQVCKLLNLSYGNKTLYKKLREIGIFFKNRNEPKQQFVDKGYFKMKEFMINDKVKLQTYFTQKGLGYIGKRLGAIVQPLKPIQIV